jgi:hypothetical protein
MYRTNYNDDDRRSLTSDPRLSLTSDLKVRQIKNSWYQCHVRGPVSLLDVPVMFCVFGSSPLVTKLRLRSNRHLLAPGIVYKTFHAKRRQ